MTVDQRGIVETYLSDEIQGALETYGENIAGPDKTGLPGVVQDYARYVCRLWARTPGLSSDGRIFGFNTACTDYLAGIGEAPVQGSTENESAQCPTDYRIQGTVTYATSGGSPIETINVDISGFIGPALGPVEVRNLPGSIQLGRLDSNPPGNFFPIATRSSNFGRQFSTWDLSFTRVDGMPDNCGSQTLVPPTPQPGLPPLSPPGDFPGPFGDLDVDIILDPTGEVCVSTGEMDLVCVEMVPDDGVPPQVPREIPQPDIGTPEDLPDGGGESEAEEGELIVYARVELTSVPSPIPGPTSPPFNTVVSGQQAYFPRIGYIKFGLDGGGFEGPYNITLDDDVFPVFTRTGARSAVIDVPSGVGVRLTLATLPESNA